MENRRWLLKSRPTTSEFSNHLELVPEELSSDLNSGQFIVQNKYLSCDPTQLHWMNKDTYLPQIPLGDVIRAAGIGEVVASKNPKYPVGNMVAGLTNWQDYYLSEGADKERLQLVPTGIPPELALSALGMTGMTAYFGLELADLKEGQTVLVSGAAGATGSIAAQIAKIKGCRVIGLAGSQEKCDWLIEAAGVDLALNYRADDLNAAIKDFAPKGINAFFDNVGGETLELALNNLALYARIIICGAISQYEVVSSQVKGPRNYMNLVMKRARMEGFLILDYAQRFEEAQKQLAIWLQSGKLTNKLDISQGLQEAPSALASLFKGSNFGKKLVQL